MSSWRWNGKMSPNGNPPLKKERRVNENVVKVEVHLPRSVYETLKSISTETMTPLSRLCCIAVDNELDTAKPFNYPIELPETPYKEYAYANEAGKILAYLNKAPEGLAPAILMLNRRDMGVPNRDDFLHGLRELFECNMVELFLSTSWKGAVKEEKIKAIRDPEKQTERFKTIEGVSIKGARRKE